VSIITDYDNTNKTNWTFFISVIIKITKYNKEIIKLMTGIWDILTLFIYFHLRCYGLRFLLLSAPGESPLPLEAWQLSRERWCTSPAGGCSQAFINLELIFLIIYKWFSGNGIIVYQCVASRFCSFNLKLFDFLTNWRPKRILFYFEDKRGYKKSGF
jgi:hypothetical protein